VDPAGPFYRTSEPTGNDSLRQQGGARDNGKSDKTGSPLNSALRQGERRQ